MKPYLPMPSAVVIESNSMLLINRSYEIGKTSITFRICTSIESGMYFSKKEKIYIYI